MKDISNKNVIHINKDGIQYLQFRKLLEYKDIINHAYGIGLDRNYRRMETLENYKDLCDAIGSNYTNCIKPYQEHTKNIACVKGDNSGEEYKATDGLITDKTNIVLATTNADCILLLFFDPVKKVIANVHSGWRGTLQRISTETIEKMKNEYECNPENIICCICPSIRKCHFKVHADVQEPYFNEFKDLEGIDNLITKIPDEDRWQIDTVEINKLILKQAGLKEDNIIDSGICSVCDSDLIHSFRVEKDGYGLSSAIIELK